MEEIKPLAQSFTRKGVLYDHVETGDSYMIYRGELAGSYWYEVFQRRINAARQIAGVDIPASEAFPSDESFGKWAWDCPDLESAQKRSAGIAIHKTLIPANG